MPRTADKEEGWQMGDEGRIEVQVWFKEFQSASVRDTDDKDVISGPRKRKLV